MKTAQENFLDLKTLAAIACLMLAWLGWDYYMRKKYPPAPKGPPPQTQAEKKEKKPALLKPDIKNLSPKKESLLEFKGDKTEILFSSKGFGVKQLKLKGYYDRQGRAVLFGSEEKPLFSSYFFENLKSPIPFAIRKEGEFFVGRFKSAQGRIKKTVQIDEESFSLNWKIEILPAKSQSFQGLSLSFSRPLPKEAAGGFFKMLFIYGQELLKGFVFYEGERRLLSEADVEKAPAYKNVRSAALGGKYFGKAFINRSALLPRARFEKSGERAFVRLDYEFLSEKAQSLEYKTFIGPKSLKSLQGLGGETKEWLDFGFFGWLARPLLLFLTWLNSWCHNWGLAIVLLTFLIRLALLPINIKSYKSMKIMQKIQPQIKELRSAHKKDPKKMNQEVMALMKKHKANPLGGCLPMFLQFPVFFALYRVLGESIELYQSPFIFWIKDLSLKDPYYFLPALGGLVLFVQQRITPMNLPKEQARLLMAMPLLFSVFMLSLPSGLTLYIFVSGLFGLAQQYCFVKWGSS